jgi:glucosamine 6-phosphate synthetase-like amidotransferase/phosphosugar isomerase protein
MCGIIGYVGRTREGEWGQTHGLLSELLKQSLHRGRDATGFCALTEPLENPANGRVITAKQPVESIEFVQRNPFWRSLLRMRCRSLVGHVRASTSGTPLYNPNNHPHDGGRRSRRFSLVHNGWFTNVREVADRHSLELRTDCDSEVAARLIERAKSIPEGMHRCMTELRGAQALAVLDHRTGTTYLSRDGNRPLWFGRLTDNRRVLYASTPQIIARAVEKRFGHFDDWVADVHPLATGYVYALTSDLRLHAVYSEPAKLGGSLVA